MPAKRARRESRCSNCTETRPLPSPLLATTYDEDVMLPREGPVFAHQAISRGSPGLACDDWMPVSPLPADIDPLTKSECRKRITQNDLVFYRIHG